MKLVIYGAQGIALGAYEAMKSLYPSRQAECFLVSSRGINASVVCDLPVWEIKEYAAKLSQKEKDDTEVLIAAPENVQPEIEETLEDYGFHYYRKLTSGRWSELMKLFHAKMGRFLPLDALPVGCHMPFVRLYMARSHKDRPLKSIGSFPSYVFPVQAGAACSSVRVADLMDNQGEHISEKNVNYSELTVLYWIWKNKLCSGGGTKSDRKQYYGLSQYRRTFVLTDDQMMRLADNDVDAVLPYPMPYEPNIHAHHQRYLKDEDWNALLTALEELSPEYAEIFPDILNQRYFYNYNVILARKNVLRDYCAWLFPILERTEELSIPKGCDRGDRYIGYMAETLETLYFMRNADELDIVHTECRLLT